MNQEEHYGEQLNNSNNPSSEQHHQAATAPHNPPPAASSRRHGMGQKNNRAPPRRVDHTYRDYSNFPLGELPTVEKAPTNFPSKLHQILSTHEYSHIISWMPHGRAWKIHNKELLIRDVAPKYFDQSKYESFTRQLIGWGFKRLHQSGNDFNAYYHDCFLRGLPHLTVLMKRVPPNQGKLLPHVEGEPNFYEIDEQFPLVRHHHHYSQSHMGAEAGAGGYGGMPAGYHSPSHYSPYPPGTYPPPPPHYGHHGAPIDPHAHQVSAAAGYPSQQPGCPPYPPYFPAQYSQPQPPGHEHYPPRYPYPPGPPGHPYGQAPSPSDTNPPY